MAKLTKTDLVKVPKSQLDLPVGFSTDGAMVTLRQATSPSADSATVTLSLAQLSSDQMMELTAKRIEMQPKFEIGAIGGGMIDKERAIAEVKAQTPLGRSLTEIEMGVIRDMKSLAQKQEAKA